MNITTNNPITTSTTTTTTIPSIKKSLRELSRASSTLALLPPHTTQPPPTHHPLLTQNGIDTAKLQRNVHELEFHRSSSTKSPKRHRTNPTQPPPPPHPSTTSLTQYLAHVRSSQLRDVLDRECVKTRRMTEERVRNRLLDDWERMKVEIGGRSVVGGRRLVVGGQGGDGDGGGLGSGVVCETYVDGDGNLPFLARAHLEVLKKSSSSSSHAADGGIGAVRLDQLAELFQGQEKRDAATFGYYNAVRLLESMLLLPSSSPSPFTTPCSTEDGGAVLTEQRAAGALDFLSDQFRSFLVSSVKKSGTFGGEAPAGRSLVWFIRCFVEMEVGREKMQWGGMDVVWRCLYYCLRCGDANAATEIAQSCNEVPSPILHILQWLSNHQQNARNIFAPSPSTTPTTTTSRITTLRNTNPPSLRQKIDDLHDRAAVLSLQHQQGSNNTNSSSIHIDPYELACLSLLSTNGRGGGGGGGEGNSNDHRQASQITVRETVATEMEDYMFLSLWNAVHSSEGGRDCERRVAGLGEDVKGWGPEYFSGGGGGGGMGGVWAYVLPLLLGQQFRSAVVHLADGGGGAGGGGGGVGGDGLCLAVHLSLGMVNAGLLTIDDVGEGGGGGGGGQQQQRGGDDDFLTRLLVMYSSSLQGTSPEAALAYLVQIPDGGESDSSSSNNGGWKTTVRTKDGKQLRHTTLEQICNLLLFASSNPSPSTTEGSAATAMPLETLVGSLSADGSRTAGAAMERYFTDGGISEILAATADRAVRRGDLARAAELLSLGGRYGTLLALLNRELASLLVVEGSGGGGVGDGGVGGIGSDGGGGGGGGKEAERVFWRNAALRFHSAYLTNGQTHVIRVLEMENKMSLGNTFELLLNLMTFFDHCREGQWERAWNLMDGLGTFPTSEDEIPQKLESFHALDVQIQRQFHHVVTYTMECLYRQHEALKENSAGVGGGDGATTTAAAVVPSVTAVQQRLNEIRTRGRLLVTFAGLLPFLNFSDGTQQARIARMEAFMI